ncbi:MAG: type II toxin-antitoxin system VapC family toxin [Vicinamibacterales bacterium]
MLLDTCVLSELQRTKGNPAVREAVEGLDSEDLFVSVLSIGEIAKGVALVKETVRRQKLAAWLAELEHFHAERLLPLDLETARIWGDFTALAQKAGRPLAAVDGLIAATAQRHGLHVMTRNVADFEITKIQILNPWA